MRKFSKKLAFVLAAAMVFTAFAPAASAKAADKMVINKKSQILYVTDGTGMNDAAQVGGGKGNVAEYDFWVKNKPTDYAKTLKFNWVSADTDVATVDNKGLTKAVGVGKTTITCTITDKAGKEVAAPTTVKVEVKRNADSVKITNAGTYEGQTVEPNGTVDLNRKMVVDGKEVGRGKYCTDYTRWCAIDPNGNLVKSGEGVTIDQTNGVYTFGEDAVEGDYTLYCETYQSKTYSKGIKESNKVTVTFEKKNDFTIAQTTSKKFVLTFDKPVDALELDVVELYKTSDGVTYELPAPFKAPTFNDDKKMSATVEFYNDVANGEVYRFTVAGAKEPKTWTVNVGGVASIKLTADVSKGTDYRYFTTNTAVDLVPTLYDANGVDVTAVALTNGYMRYEAKVSSADGTYSVSDGDNNKASIYALNDNAKVEVLATYYTGTVDENGVENKVVESFVFFSKAAAAELITGMEYAKLGDSKGTFLTVALGTNGRTLAIKPIISTKDSKDVSEYGYGDFIEAGGKNYMVTFEETDNDVLAIDRNNGTLYLFQEGTTKVVAYITANEANATPVALGVFTVKVTEAVRLDSVSLSNGSVSVGIVEGLDIATVTVNGKDNYGGDCNTGYTVELEANNTLAKKSYVTAPSVNGNDIQIDGSALAEVFRELADVQMSALLTYKVNVKVNGQTKWVKDLSITVKRFNPNTAATSYLLELQPNTGFGDVTRKYTDNTEDYAEAPKTAVYNIYRLKNGIKAQTMSVNAYVPNKAGLTTANVGEFYVRVQKDGQDVAIDGTKIVLGTAADGTTNLTLNFSGTENDGNNKTVVSYNGMGAGNYVITLYELKKVGNTNNVEYYTVANGSVSGRATVNAGSYKLVSKDTAKAADATSLNLAKCFTINDKNGAKVDWTNENLDFVVDATYTTGNSSVGSDSVFVKTITFYEAVDTNVFVPYVVNINSSLKIR